MNEPTARRKTVASDATEAQAAPRDDAEWITPRVTRLELETAQATF